MVKLLDTDIMTREVLEWEGVHLFHFHGSSCSQKTRICFNLSHIDYTPHVVDLFKGENYTEYYLGINPRGLVPTLVYNGEVHIESNDIILFADENISNFKLVPQGSKGEMRSRLEAEDDLHLDLRTITMRFTQPRGDKIRSDENLQNYQEFGSGTVEGILDINRDRELNFWRKANDGGISDEAVKLSANKFKAELDQMDTHLKDNSYLLHDSLSVIDVAWVIYINRLVFCGYPLERLHPNVAKWFWPLRKKKEFDSELTVSPALQEAVNQNHRHQIETCSTLIDVANL